MTTQPNDHITTPPKSFRHHQIRLPDESEIHAMAETFKALDDPTRLRILVALTQHELCVHDLAKAINMSISAVSHHLRMLRNLKLVKYRKKGKMVYYALDDEHIENLIISAREHVNEL